MENLRDKVLLVVSQNYASFVKDQVESIAPYFRRVYVLAVTRPVAEISNFLPIHSLKPFRQKVKINLSELPENVTVITTPLYYLPFSFWYKKVGEQHLRAVRKAIKKNDISFDIIHCHFTYSSGYVGKRLKEEFRVPLIVTAHGFDVYDLPFRNAFWQKKVAATLKSANRIITVSKNNVECIRRIGVETAVDLIPNGYQKKLFYPLGKIKSRRTLQLPESGKVIVSVGNLIAVKGHKYLVEAVSGLQKQHKDLFCYIIGSGGCRKQLEAQISRLGLGEKVILVGALRHDEINTWLGAADMFVLPSLKEGNPTVLFESLACGCPFISAHVGGVSEIIDDEKLGYLFHPGNVKDMEVALGKALTRHWDKEYIIEKSQAYSWECIAVEIVKSYGAVLESC
ncbi:glycosyltransferase [Desulfocapsa sulfexigens DSM 10523]|uniref:Glycosyltransferase n=1 Tax=Desulfocapsa sulfexigens (strain DSM 10523 / SB164P1) TaxID=1167006 RepID=M1PRG8_DESSD|nr:glycosyltransferase [Desulfocapsa sulfexigens]AGF78951.1 glycosyltransferase [Desulfocapsa sulfexigens DSM 10523]